MKTATVKEVLVKSRITKNTKLLKGRLTDTGEILEFPFDDSEFPDGVVHENVLSSYLEEGIEILDWTSQTYFE